MFYCMKIKEALAKAIILLENSNTPMLDARVLLGSALHMPLERLLINYDSEISEENEQKFFKLIKRRQEFEPIAYIIGTKEFYGREFIVNNNVLIPRPDTELLIDVMAKLARSQDSAKILELGCGSGAICVSLALEIITAQITATDISEHAIETSKQNAQKHNVSKQIHFIKSDWYNNIDDNQYDYIISNPPYIDKSEQSQMAAETHMHEPELALYADDNGLSAYKIIIESACKYLKKSGILILEIGYLQKNSIVNLLEKNGFYDIQTHKDLAQHDRLITCKVKHNAY